MLDVSRDKRNVFTGWYEDILVKAGIYDHRYPLKGAGVWMPYGFQLREKVYGYLKKLHKKNHYYETLFPTLIPEDLFKREAEHLVSFEKEVFWVTKGGAKELQKKYVLRPTSETAMYYMFSLWANSYSDLPIKIYQIVSVFRYETKATHPLYREREVTTFFESHCAFATSEENEREVKIAMKMYQDFFDWLGIPYIISKRPDWDKFPGADYTLAFDTIMPNGRTLQIGTVHNLGQNFSKAFNIEIDLPDGRRDYVYQMCFGVSGRVITSLIAIHGDDHGLVLPPNVSPIDIVIIPIIYKEKSEEIIKVANDIKRELAEKGYSVVLDDTDDTPGSKFYKWELKGVPIRLEIGPRDLAEDTVTLVRRDTLERKTVNRKFMINEIEKLREDIYNFLKERAKNEFESKIKYVVEQNDIVKTVEAGYVVLVDWCGKQSCAEALEEETGLKLLGTKFNKEGEPENARGEHCIYCGDKANFTLVIAKSY